MICLSQKVHPQLSSSSYMLGLGSQTIEKGIVPMGVQVNKSTTQSSTLSASW
jgi:hypothetical protein